MTTAAELDLSSLDKDPRLFLYTSLTAGSSHIVTATSRMETILKANRIPFLAVDIATDEKCRRLWQRRGGAKKKLPGLVKEGYIIGDLEEVEEWNEFGELKENIGPVPPSNTAPPGAHTGVSTAPPLSANVTAAQGNQVQPPQSQSGFDKTKAVALPGAEEMAAIHKAKKANEAAAATSTTAKQVPAATASEPESAASKPREDDKPTSGEKETPQITDSKPSPQESKKDDDPPAEGTAHLQVNEAETPSRSNEIAAGLDTDKNEQTTQDQPAKEPAAAGTSVED